MLADGRWLQYCFLWLTFTGTHNTQRIERSRDSVSQSKVRTQCEASSVQREPPLLVPVSEDPACRKVCDGVVAPSDDPISDGRRCPDENPDSNASSAEKQQASSEDVGIIRWSRGTLQRRSKLKNFIVPVKIEKPWDSGYLASYHRGSLQATTGTTCQGTSKGAKTTSSSNKITVKTKQEACSAVLTCTRIPKAPGEKTPKKARGQGRQRAAKDGAAGCEKKTAVDSAVEQFEPAAVKKLKAIESALKAPNPPRKPHAAAATKSKPRGRKKKQEMVPAVGTEVRRRSAGAEATPRFNKTAVRQVKNGETPAPFRKVPTQVQSTYELHRRSLKNGRNLEVAVTGSVAEAAAVQVAGKRSFQATLPSTAVPDLEGSADEGVVNTEASASATLQYASPQSPVESSYARTCNEATSPTQSQRSAATSTQSECIEDSHGTQHDSIVPVEASSPGPVAAGEIIAREPSDKVATIEEATSAALDVIKSTSETHSLSSPGASAPLESASPESIPVESSDTRTSNEAALPTKFQRSATASTKSGCIKVSQGTQCNYCVAVEGIEPGRRHCGRVHGV
ncbi:hypothetical protein HPB51_021803 [Rhipicephalus microplus]|uniref:Uncharacterized protein n=1 Tax=Rhipicephalus microplus TaxID=6941 RepID=A0A9J6DCH3_RHIMP|nr:hypothetical protein HPB51_021803 [Rhipicephalus microplus]